MGYVKLPDIEKRVVPNCDFLWSQRVINQAQKIIDYCGTEENIKKFFIE